MNKADIQKRIIAIFREVYKSKEPVAQILKTDPNSFDMDPEMFYDMVTSEFGLDAYMNQNRKAYFGRIGGTVQNTISFIVVFGPHPPVPTASKGSSDYDMLDNFLDNLALNSKLPMDRNIKVNLDMYKIDSRADFKVLKQQTQQALEQKHIERVVELAQKHKLKSLGAAEIEALLNRIVGA